MISWLGFIAFFAVLYMGTTGLFALIVGRNREPGFIARLWSTLFIYSGIPMLLILTLFALGNGRISPLLSFAGILFLWRGIFFGLVSDRLKGLGFLKSMVLSRVGEIYWARRVKAVGARRALLGALLLVGGFLYPRIGLSESFTLGFSLWGLIEFLNMLFVAIKVSFIRKVDRPSLIKLDAWPFDKATIDWPEFRDYILQRQATGFVRWILSINKPVLVIWGIAFLISIVFLAWMLYTNVLPVASFILALDIGMASVWLETLYQRRLKHRVQELSATEFA